MTNWPEPLTITIFGGMVVTVIGSIVTGIVTIITAVRVGVVAKQQDMTASSLLTVQKDTETIKGHVNSEKTAAEGREAAQKMEIQLLREQLADEKTTKRLLAQAAALIPALATVPPTPEVPIAAKLETIQATAEGIDHKVDVIHESIVPQK